MAVHMFPFQSLKTSTCKKKEYVISVLLQKIKYVEHNWVVCVNLKMVNFLLNQQSGN